MAAAGVERIQALEQPELAERAAVSVERAAAGAAQDLAERFTSLREDN